MNLTKIISVLLGLLAVAGLYIYHTETVKQLKGRVDSQAEIIQQLVSAPPDTVLGDTAWLPAEPVKIDTEKIEAELRKLLLSELSKPDTVFIGGDTVFIPAEPEITIDSLTYAEIDSTNNDCHVWVRYWLEPRMWQLKIDNYLKAAVLIETPVKVFPEYSWSIGGFILAGSRAYGGIYGSYGIGKLNVMTGVGLPGCMLVGVGFRGEIWGK